MILKEANTAKLMSANESPIRQGELRDTLTDHDYNRWEDFLKGNVQLPDDLLELDTHVHHPPPRERGPDRRRPQAILMCLRGFRRASACASSRVS